MPAAGSFSIPDFWEIRAHTDHDRGGFSQSWHLPPMSVSAAKALASKIISYRSFLYGKGQAIASASMSQYIKFKDGYTPDTYNAVSARMTGEATVALIATVNDFQVGPMWRLETSLGKFANHTIRGVRDAWIAANVATTTSFTPLTLAATDALTGAVDTTATEANLYDRYLSVLIWYTVHIQINSKTAFVNGTRTLDGTAKYWTGAEYRRLSSRDVGRRFSSGRGRQAAWA